MVNRTPWIIVCIFILIFIVTPGLSADSVEDMLQQVEDAVIEESYTRAIALLEEGKKSHPQDFRFPLRAGHLYMGRELYHLALAEFKAAEILNPSSGEVLYEMAETNGYLGKNDEAVKLLERLLTMDNDPELKDDVIDNLSWMYFKTYRMDDGISLLETALKDKFNRNWAHTLGTLYAGLYNPDQSRYWYMKSIDDALNNGDDFFASVAYYNLSLLDYSFYLYGNAREEALRSLDLRSRSGGYMIIGELDFLAWNLDDAIESYRKAESKDETPLSRVDIASFYQRIGYLDEAIRFIQEIQNDTDNSWMYHYGVNRMRFEMDLYLILADSWKGKAHLSALTPRAGIKGRFESFTRGILWSLKGMYHNRLYRSLTSRYSRELREEGNELDAVWNAAIAARGYRKIALGYLEEARLIETELTPRAVPWYEMDIGKESGDIDMLENALKSFSEEEGDPYERTLRELAGTSIRYLNELYQINPGGLRQYGLSLP
ncbi:MAG: hypothetical protein KAH21_07535, partial [Spirochaetaceae bacterium]|nr:hypothetical protein [Spirochaetaceae bacterium]